MTVTLFERIATESVIIPVTAMLVAVALVFVVLHFRHQRHQQLLDTVRHLADKGQPVPPELLQPPPEPESASPLIGALSAVGAGLGLMVFFQFGLEGLRWLWGVGAIPLVIGVGMCIALFIERRGRR